MEDKRKLLIVNNKLSFLQNVIFCVFISCLVLFFLFIPHDYLLLPSFILTISFVLFFVFLKRKADFIGYIILDEISLLISINNILNTILVSDIKEIRFCYMGYNGRGKILNRDFDNGFGNKLIMLHCDGTKYNYDVFLEEYHVLIMKKVFEEWKKRGVKIKTVNSYGIPIEI